MSKQRILIVEDHPVLLNAVSGLLENNGYAVTATTNGQEALEKMADQPPDLILSDIMMPKMDGYDFYNHVRENPQWTRIPFIFLTAKGESEDIKRGKSLGVEDYLSKPFDAEEVLITVHARLSRAADIQAATEEEFEETKQQIINVLSHELRTPLTYISGYTELALEDADSLSPEDMLTFLSGIKQGADRLQKLVEDLLIGTQINVGQSAIEFNKFALVREDLDDLILTCTNHCESKAAEEDVILETELAPQLPPARIYERFFVDALMRIIDNAIKFSQSEPKKVLVSAYAEKDTIYIEIKDHGIGIAQESLTGLFQRLNQFDRDKMEQQGSGMGLFIAHSFIALHDGDITVESELGAGSTFTITLPAAH